MFRKATMRNVKGFALDGSEASTDNFPEPSRRISLRLNAAYRRSWNGSLPKVYIKWFGGVSFAGRPVEMRILRG
jgi:hypothetical protein